MTVAEWSTIANLATALGTLILAIATFSAVRSSNLMARVAQQQLLIQLRPVLSPSRREDPTLKVNFGDLKWVQIPGGGAVGEVGPGDGSMGANTTVVYLAIALRNAGNGIAVLQGLAVLPGRAPRPGSRAAGGVPAADQGPVHTGGRRGFLAGGVPGHRSARLRTGARRHRGAPAVGGGAALRRPRGRPAGHQPLPGAAGRPPDRGAARRPPSSRGGQTGLARLREQALEPRSRGRR
jgi:hypothetical protein